MMKKTEKEKVYDNDSSPHQSVPSIMGMCPCSIPSHLKSAMEGGL